LPKVTQETTNNPGEIVDLRIEIWTRDIPNAKQKC
jgi:hypothetical protein